MKTAFSLVLATATVLSLIFAFTPGAMADSGDGSKTHKSYWTISIEDASGSLHITQDTNMDALKEKAISMDEATAGYENMIKARLSQAINNSGDYFLVWKVVTESDDGEDSTLTVNAVDAGTGELLASKTKEGGGCGYKKSGTASTGGQA